MMRGMNDEKARGVRLAAILAAVCLWGLAMWAGGAQAVVFAAEAGETEVSAQAAQSSQRLFDEADRFNEEYEAELEASIGECRKWTGADIVVVTAYAQLGRDAQEYADDFYDQGGFGEGKDYSGVLLLFYMDGPDERSGEIWISTSGTMTRILTDQRIDKMLDNVIDYVKASDYPGGVRRFLEDVAFYVSKGIEAGQYNYDQDTGAISVYHSIRWYEALLALAVSLGVAYSVCAGIKRSYRLKPSDREQTNSLLAYQGQCHFHFQETSDQLVNQFVTTARIPKVNTSVRSGSGGGSRGSSGRSTIHHSSGGRSHGGGGRRF